MQVQNFLLLLPAIVIGALWSFNKSSNGLINEMVIGHGDSSQIIAKINNLIGTTPSTIVSIDRKEDASPGVASIVKIEWIPRYNYLLESREALRLWKIFALMIVEGGSLYSKLYCSLSLRHLQDSPLSQLTIQPCLFIERLFVGRAESTLQMFFQSTPRKPFSANPSEQASTSLVLEYKSAKVSTMEERPKFMTIYPTLLNSFIYSIDFIEGSRLALLQPHYYHQNAPRSPPPSTRNNSMINDSTLPVISNDAQIFHLNFLMQSDGDVKGDIASMAAHLMNIGFSPLLSVEWQYVTVSKALLTVKLSLKSSSSSKVQAQQVMFSLFDAFEHLEITVLPSPLTALPPLSPSRHIKNQIIAIHSPTSVIQTQIKHFNMIAFQDNVVYSVVSSSPNMENLSLQKAYSFISLYQVKPVLEAWRVLIDWFLYIMMERDEGRDCSFDFVIVNRNTINVMFYSAEGNNEWILPLKKISEYFYPHVLY